ncbi:MAG: hypothetical protein HFH01_00615 [Dorea sp.]|nr:hypothetical protein [Dorea sp.]
MISRWPPSVIEKQAAALEGSHEGCVLGMPRLREHGKSVTYRGAKREFPVS